jgi:hypothetical protein
MRGEGMPECVARDSFRETGHYHGLSDRFLHEGFVKMTATLVPGSAHCFSGALGETSIVSASPAKRWDVREIEECLFNLLRRRKGILRHMTGL